MVASVVVSVVVSVVASVVVSVVVSADEHENGEKRTSQNRNIYGQKEIRFQPFLAENGTFFMELMTRIELVTSSLPTNDRC